MAPTHLKFVLKQGLERDLSVALVVGIAGSVHQREVILGMVEASADEIAKARKVAFVASRTNTLLSIPMLMSMVGYGHGGFFL